MEAHEWARLSPEQQQELLESMVKLVRLIADDWFVAGEMYQQCFFCGEIEPGDTEHRAECPVLEAKQLLDLLSMR